MSVNTNNVQTGYPYVQTEPDHHDYPEQPDYYDKKQTDYYDKKQFVDDEQVAFTFQELLTLPTQLTKYFLDPLLPPTGLAAIVGKPDSGKSMLARSLAMHVALGMQEFIGFPLNPARRKVLYVATEDSKQVTKDIFSRQLAGLLDRQVHAPEKISKIMDNLHFIFGDVLTPDELLREISRKMSEIHFDLVIIDSFGDSFGGRDGNSNSEVRNALRPFYALASRHECLILFISHINKSGYNAAPDQVHAQGASAFGQKIRTLIDFRLDTDENYRLLSVTKGNGVPYDFKKYAYRLFFDQTLFLYDNTGEKMAVADIGKQEFAKLDIDWKAVFGEDTEHNSRELVRRVMEHYDIKERQARHYIGTQLQRTRRGWYTIPNGPIVELEPVDY